MLGRDLCALLQAGHEVKALTRSDADVTDAPALFSTLRSLEPELVINCAGATDVDRCEQEPDWAYRVNAWGAWSAASAAEACGVRLIHISTDFVFSGALGRPYTEWDAPSPVSEYGKSKLAGEEAVRRACRRATIVRTQWLYGRHGRCFPWSILSAARRNPEGGLKVVADQWGAPTCTRHLARKLAWLVDWPIDGLYHINNAGSCTRFEWAHELLSLAGLEVPLSPIPAEEWPAPAQRPGPDSTLRRYALELMGQDDLPDWRAGLAEWVRELREAGEL